MKTIEAQVETNGTHEPELTRATQAVVVHHRQEVTVFGTSDPVKALEKAAEVASALKAVIAKQGLIKRIQNKDYPMCEAWTLLGTMLGVFPVLEWTRRIENGWEARVEARTRNGDLLGAAEAECLKTEKLWSNRDDYAIRSMAQTRATAKALRMPLGFVMTLAGFQPTPAEEMPHDPGAGGSQPPTGRAGANTPKPTARTNTSPQANPVPPREAPAKTVKTVSPPCATEEQKKRFLIELAQKLGDDVGYAVELCWKIGWLLQDVEGMSDLQLRFVPPTRKLFDLFIACVIDFKNGNAAVRPYPPNDDTEPPKKEAKKPVEVPRDENCDYDSPDAPWRSFVCTYGKGKGKTLAKMDKGLLYGYWAGHEVTTSFEGRDGKPIQKKPAAIEADRKFRAMLDEAGKHYNFEKKEQD